jgi:hypothetical protein
VFSRPIPSNQHGGDVGAVDDISRSEESNASKGFHTQIDLSEKFLTALLVRNIALEADLCDQLFNHGERRLARVLLKLARLREHAVLT